MKGEFRRGHSGEQLRLVFPNGWGGRRQGAGRKRAAERGRVPHRRRAEHRASEPVHVTLRMTIRSLRSQFVFPTVAGVIRDANRAQEARFRIVEFSVQADHVHLLVEADDKAALQTGMRSFSARLARRVNRLLFRRGPLVADRWHGRALTSPRAVRQALVYVLANHKKHEPASAKTLDAYSSAPYFTSFAEFPGRRPCAALPNLVPPALRLRAPPTAPATSWLLRVGWLRHGSISIAEAPRT